MSLSNAATRRLISGAFLVALEELTRTTPTMAAPCTLQIKQVSFKGLPGDHENLISHLVSRTAFIMLQTVLCPAVAASPHGNGSAVFTRPATAPAVAMYTQDLPHSSASGFAYHHFLVHSRTNVKAYIRKPEELKGQCCSAPHPVTPRPGHHFRHQAVLDAEFAVYL